MVMYCNLHCIIQQIWKHKEKQGVYEWTSLRGNDRVKLLKKLPQATEAIMPGRNGQKTLGGILYTVHVHTMYTQCTILTTLLDLTLAKLSQG